MRRRGGGCGVCGDRRKDGAENRWVGGGEIIDLRTGKQEEGEVQVQIDQSIVQTGTDERNSSPRGGVMCTKYSAEALTKS